MRGGWGGRRDYKGYPWLSPLPSLKNAAQNLKEGPDTSRFARHLAGLSLSFYTGIGQEPKGQIYPPEGQAIRVGVKGGK